MKKQFTVASMVAVVALSTGITAFAAQNMGMGGASFGGNAGNRTTEARDAGSDRGGDFGGSASFGSASRGDGQQAIGGGDFNGNGGVSQGNASFGMDNNAIGGGFAGGNAPQGGVSFGGNFNGGNAGDVSFGGASRDGGQQAIGGAASFGEHQNAGNEQGPGRKSDEEALKEGVEKPELPEGVTIDENDENRPELPAFNNADGQDRPELPEGVTVDGNDENHPELPEGVTADDAEQSRPQGPAFDSANSQNRPQMPQMGGNMMQGQQGGNGQQMSPIMMGERPKLPESASAES